ncbi:hypothetical protein [Tepidibacillus fermentans]|uniref:hypothetical protein n=1 Tax=Tepidibacillus fermentans TaxID=1281767 RepID=UPI00104BA5A4|nr:hypothetical protein [Tepidibacillus fermentans]
MRKHGILYWVLLILFIIGIAQSFFINPSGILIPLIVFGTIYYFYKHPEKVFWILNRNRNHSRHTKYALKRKRRRFTVIKGNKDDDPTRYH